MFNFRNIFGSCCNVTQNRDIEVDLTSNTYPDDGRHEHYTKNGYNDGKITPDDIAHGPQLKMTAIESTLLALNTEFRINPGGLALGGRSKNDGETYIGLKSDNGNQNKANDILLEDSSVGNQHCMIKYDPIKRSYFLHDLGEGSGTFIKIEKELEMKSGYIISFSDSHMLIHTRDVMSGADEEQAPQQDDKKGNITIKFLDGPKVDEVFKFKAEEKTIKIGRMADCQIKFDDNNLSRYQCTFKYFNNAWYIMDGFRAKSSTNGTWLLVDNKVELFHDTVIKIGQTLFKVEIQTGNQG